jgi:group I intron endonuclease
MIGIYRIINLINNKCYYGSSKNVEKRWKKHKNELVRDKHHNILLQRAWNKYGCDSFMFEFVEACMVDELLLVEQKYLDTKPEYNIGLISSGGDNITNNPDRLKIIENMSEAVKLKISLMTDKERKDRFSKPKERNPNWRGGSSVKLCVCGAEITPINNTCLKCRNKEGKNNPFYNKKHTKETKKILSDLRLGKKPSNMKKIMIDGVEYESITNAYEITGIPKPTIFWRLKSRNKKFEGYVCINS